MPLYPQFRSLAWPMRGIEFSPDHFDLLLKSGQRSLQLLPSPPFGLKQLTQFSNVPSEFFDTRNLLGDGLRRRLDEHPLARLTDHEPVSAQLGNGRPGDSGRYLVPPRELGRRRNGRPHGKLPSGDVPTQIPGDPLVRREPDRLSHRTILQNPTPLTRPANHMHYVEHSVLAWSWTTVDRSGPVQTPRPMSLT